MLSYLIQPYQPVHWEVISGRYIPYIFHQWPNGPCFPVQPYISNETWKSICETSNQESRTSLNWNGGLPSWKPNIPLKPSCLGAYVTEILNHWVRPDYTTPGIQGDSKGKGIVLGDTRVELNVAIALGNLSVSIPFHDVFEMEREISRHETELEAEFLAV